MAAKSQLKYLIDVSRKQDNSPGYDPTKSTSYVVYSTTPDDPHAQLFILTFNYQTRLFFLNTRSGAVMVQVVVVGSARSALISKNI